MDTMVVRALLQSRVWLFFAHLGVLQTFVTIAGGVASAGGAVALMQAFSQLPIAAQVLFGIAAFLAGLALVGSVLSWINQSVRAGGPGQGTSGGNTYIVGSFPKGTELTVGDMTLRLPSPDSATTRSGDPPPAVLGAHLLGINPGGEVVGFEVPPEHVPPPAFLERLLTREEAESLP